MNVGAGARVDARDDRRDSGLVGLRHRALGQDVLHRDRDHLADVGARMVRARAHRLARVGIEHAALRHDQLDLLEEALVLRDLRIHHRGDLPDRVATRVAVRRPRLELGPHVGARVVDGERLAVDRDLDVQVDVGVAERVVVDVGVALVHAVGPLRDFLAEAAGRVVDHRVDARFDGLGAVAVDDLGEVLHAELCGADLRVQVADVARDAVVGLECVQHVAPFDAAVDHLHDRPAHALAPDVGGGDVVAAGHAAAGVAVMALDARDQHHAPGAVGTVGEHGREHVVVGEVAATVVRVVGDEHVALVELVDAEEVEREPHRQGRREHELWDADRQRGQAARRVEHGGVALVRLVEDRRGGGARHVLRHLEAHRLHAAPDHLGGHGVDGARLGQARPAAGEANEIDVCHAATTSGSASRVIVGELTEPPVCAWLVMRLRPPALHHG